MSNYITIKSFVFLVANNPLGQCEPQADEGFFLVLLDHILSWKHLFSPVWMEKVKERLLSLIIKNKFEGLER